MRAQFLMLMLFLTACAKELPEPQGIYLGEESSVGKIYFNGSHLLSREGFEITEASDVMYLGNDVFLNNGTIELLVDVYLEMDGKEILSYDGYFDTIAGIDSASFILAPDSKLFRHNISKIIGKDKNSVYIRSSEKSTADPELYHVYIDRYGIKGNLDFGSFEHVSGNFYRDKHSSYYWDADDLYRLLPGEAEPTWKYITGSETSNLGELYVKGYLLNTEEGRFVSRVDKEFTYLGNELFKDASSMYYAVYGSSHSHPSLHVIEGANPNTFVIVENPVARFDVYGQNYSDRFIIGYDTDAIYILATWTRGASVSKEEGVDFSTFQHVGEHYYADKHGLIYWDSYSPQITKIDLPLDLATLSINEGIISDKNGRYKKSWNGTALIFVQAEEMEYDEKGLPVYS